MKKLIYCAVALAMTLIAGSCQRENLELVENGQTITYTLQLPDVVQTKALGDDVTNVTNLHYEVWRTEGEEKTDFSDVDNRLYKDLKPNAFDENGKATIEFQLINNQNFTVLFWADVPDNGMYITEKLTEITINQNATLEANQEKYVAFSGLDFIKKTDKNLTGRVAKLSRAVSQLNIGTTPESLTQFEDKVNLLNSKVSVTGLYSSYNVATKAVEGDIKKTYEFNSKPVPTKITENGDKVSETFRVNDKDYTYIAMNYVGFAQESGSTINVKYEFDTSEGKIENEIPNVPIKANYRTNIVGNLISSTSSYEVTLDKNWASTEYVGPEFVQVPAFDGKTWTITNADELAWVAASVNGTIGIQTKAGATTKTFKGETVVLANDIDLQGAEWEPIGDATKFFEGTFDGKDHTISNYKVTEKAGHVGLFGNARATIKNLKVNNVTLKANHYAGAIVGQGYCRIDKCHAENINIIVTIDPTADNGNGDYGDKAGAIIGQNCEGALTITDCTAKNVIIEGYRDLGGIVGMAHDRNIVKNNSVDNVTIIQNLENAYKTEEVPTTLGAIIGREGVNVVKNDSNSGSPDSNSGSANIKTAIASGVYASKIDGTDSKGNPIVTEYSVYAAEGLEWVAGQVDQKDVTFEGKTLVLVTDLDFTGNEWNPIGDNRIEGAAFSGTFDGQNHTIKGTNKSSFDGSNYGSKEGWGLFSVTDGATIKNLKVDGATFGSYTVISGTIAGYANNTTFDNIEISNTKISGYNWYTGGVVGWAAGNCTFKGIDLDSTTSVGTLWDSHGQSAGGIAGGISSSATITIEDCNIACVLDVINDVTSNYKWWIYRVSGMIIGNISTTQTINGKKYPNPSNVTCQNVTVTYGDWMNYHYCQGYWNRGWGRVESSDYVGGIDHTQCNHPDGESHYVCVPFDQLFGGGPNGDGRSPVYGLAEYPGVTVYYPESFYREQGYKANGDTYTIYSGKGFKDIATTVLNDGTKNVTIELANDIDLAGIEWPAVKTAAAFVLDGKGYSIKNLTTSAVEDHGFYSTAMFTSTRKATTIKNLVVENATVVGKGGDNSHGAVLVACNYAALNIEGVTVKNSAVSNCDRSSALVTYLYFTTATVKDCVVEGCTVNSIGTAGALLGMNNSHNFEATGNTVKNTTISSSEGGNKAGILIGTWQNAGTLTEANNVVENSKAINAGTETNNHIGREVTVK